MTIMRCALARCCIHRFSASLRKCSSWLGTLTRCCTGDLTDSKTVTCMHLHAATGDNGTIYGSGDEDLKILFKTARMKVKLAKCISESVDAEHTDGKGRSE